MKLITLFLTTIITQVVLATNNSNYEPIVDTSKVWIIISDVSPLYNQNAYTTAYKFTDSTQLSDGNYWYKLCQSTDKDYQNWNHIYYLRESDSIVTCYDFNKSSSLSIDTLYNFRKKIGDNINPKQENDSVIIYDTSLDFFAGKYRHKQTLLNNYGTNYEGIGNTRGIIEPLQYNYTGSYSKILCFHKSGELLYKDPDFNDCFITTSILDFNLKESIIFPNPASTDITINIKNFENNSEYDITILNSLGQTIEVYELKDKNASIDISRLISGQYYYTIKKNNIIIDSGTFLKE